MLLWWLWLLVQKDSLQHMPRLALLASVALGAIAAFLFANRWLSVMGDDETRQTLAALAALPFMAALWVHQMYPAPGRAVGKEAPSLGPVDLVAEAELPLITQSKSRKTLPMGSPVPKLNMDEACP